MRVDLELTSSYKHQSFRSNIHLPREHIPVVMDDRKEDTCHVKLSVLQQMKGIKHFC